MGGYMFEFICDYSPRHHDMDIIKDGLYEAHKDIIGEREKEFE